MMGAVSKMSEGSNRGAVRDLRKHILARNGRDVMKPRDSLEDTATITIDPEEFLKTETDQEFLERLVVTPESFESYSMRHEYDVEIIDMPGVDKGVVLRMQRKESYAASNAERLMDPLELNCIKWWGAVALVCAQRSEYAPGMISYYGLPVRKTTPHE